MSNYQLSIKVGCIYKSFGDKNKFNLGEKGGTFKSGGAVWIRMCEYNFKKPNFGYFFKKGGKNEKNMSLFWKITVGVFFSSNFREN